MGLEELQRLVDLFAIGPVGSRQAVRDAFAEAKIAVPDGKLAADADASGPTVTLLLWVDDYAGQATFIGFDDDKLPEQVVESLLTVNGWGVASPADATSAAEQFAIARVMSLIDPVSIDEWLRTEDAGEAGCPDQEELDGLSKGRSRFSFVVNDDGSIWKHGPKPPRDLLDLRYSRVVSFNRTM